MIMKIFNSYFSGLKSASRLKKMITLIYGITILLSLALATPFHATLSSQAGNTMALHSLLKHFDYTTYTDFMRVYGKAITPFLGSAFWLSAFYLLFTIFFAGGVLNILNGEEQKFTIKNFLDGCGKFFFRFFRLAIYIILILILITAIVFMPVGMIVASAYQTVQSEATLFYIILTGSIIYAFFFILVLMISDYAKIILFKEDSKKSFRSVWSSTKFVFKHFFGTYFLYLLLLTAPILFLIIYFLLDNSIGMVSGFTIFIMFLIQQVFIWLRIFVKIWFLRSEVKFYELNFKAKEIVIDSSTEINPEGLTGNI